MSKFQLLPPLSTEEYERLEASIKHHGTCTIEADENDDILDGHHRYEICQKHNIPLEIIRIDNLQNDLEKMAYVLKINSARRQMSGEQEKEVDKERKRIAKELYEITNSDGNRVYTQDGIAGLIGVSREWVKKWLNTKPDSVSNGTHTNTYTKPKRVSQKIGKVEKESILEALDSGATQAEVAAEFKVTRPRINQIKRTAEKKQAKMEERKAKLQATKDEIKLGDLRDLGQEVPDNSIDLIFTDPPYGKKAIDDYEQLAIFAARTLKPGASLLVYSGQSVLPEVFATLTKYLNYWWIICMEHNGQNQRLAGKFVYVEWKPIIWFVKGNRRDSHFISDMIKSKQDKSIHEWGQGIEEAKYYIEQLTQEGELICDPFMGGATTLLAAKKLGRKYLGFEKNLNTYERMINDFSEDEMP